MYVQNELITQGRFLTRNDVVNTISASLGLLLVSESLHVTLFRTCRIICTKWKNIFANCICNAFSCTYMTHADTVEKESCACMDSSFHSVHYYTFLVSTHTLYIHIHCVSCKNLSIYRAIDTIFIVRANKPFIPPPIPKARIIQPQSIHSSFTETN